MTLGHSQPAKAPERRENESATPTRQLALGASHERDTAIGCRQQCCFAWKAALSEWVLAFALCRSGKGEAAGSICLCRSLTTLPGSSDAPAPKSGPLGHWHRLVAERTKIALQAVPAPRAVLDVGCGTGVLLRLLAERVRGQVPLLGVDPSPAMITAGQAVGDLDARVCLVEGAAEDLPFPDDRFDLVVSSVSIDHWADQIVVWTRPRASSLPEVDWCLPISSQRGW